MISRNQFVSRMRTQILCFLLLIGLTNGHRLNVPKVLLPHHSSIPVNFTLEITDPPGSCFRWRSSRPEVVTVKILREEKEDEELDGAGRDCSGRAVVSAVSRSAHKMTAVIFAEEVGRDTVLRCDVMVDKIDSIDIITTTREIFLEDAPEEFSVRALNDQGDTFSELGGLAFEWTLHGAKSSVDPPNKQQILKIIPYSESEYDTPEPIAHLERKGQQGHMVLMEGVSTGSGQLTVKPRDPEYQKIKPMTISVLVVANIMLNPSYDVRIPVHGLVHYTVELIKQGKAEVISMPSPQYYLQLSDSDVGDLSTEKSEVTGLALGTTEIALKDRNVEGDIAAFHTPSAFIHVVTPGSLHFGVEPGRVWVLEKGRKYEIFLELLDSEANKMYITQNMRFDAIFPTEYFKVATSSKNGSHFEVTATKIGHTVLSGTYRAIIKEGREILVSPLISGEQGVSIFDPIQMIPQVVAFPWDPLSKARYQFQLRARGGSGDYHWASAHRQVATVGESSGMLSTQELGNATLIVSDLKNRIHRAHGTVVITPPTRMAFSKRSSLEVEVGKRIQVGLNVFGELDGGEVAFSDCRKMGIEITVADGGILLRSSESNVDSGPPGNGCTSISFTALKVGDTKVKAVYRQNDFVLHADTVISVYAPLEMNPGFSPLIAIGSGWTLAFEGGPRPWIMDGSKWFANLEEVGRKTNEKDLTTIVPVTKSRVSGFNVYCRGIGDAKMKLTVGNGETATNHVPATSQETITICCSVPQQLKLSPNLAVHDGESGVPPCPIIESNRLPVPAFEKGFPIYVTGLGSCENDRDGGYRVFDNLSSLVLDWEVKTGAELVTLPTKGSLAASEAAEQKDVGSPVLGFRYFETIGSRGKEGAVTLSAKVDTFHQDPCGGPQCDSQLIPSIFATVDLILVKSVTADPATISIFNHPDNKVNVKLLKGSGYFHVVPDQLGIATVTHQENSLTVTPRKNGQVSLRVLDLCLQNSEALVDVSVADIRTLEITGPDIVEVGKSIRLAVRVKDELGRQLSKKYFRFMNIQPLIDLTGLIEWSEDKGSSLDDAIAFNVKGLAVGNAQFVMKAKRADNQQATSQPHLIQVFAPLLLLPKHITLIQNTEFQIEALGGPQPRLSLVFSTNETGMVDVTDNSGMIKSNRLGHVRVTGRVMAPDTDGEPRVISEDSVTVHVVALSGVVIKIPITTILSGEEAPVYAVGRVEGQSPHSFVGALSPLLFEWSMDNSDTETGTLLSVYHKANLAEEQENSFARRLIAKQPGRLTIRLKATIPGGKSFTDSVQVTVIEPLQLTAPGPVCNGKLLLTPSTEMILKTNRPANHVHYRVVEQGERNVVSINEGNGLLRSGSSTGNAILFVVSNYGSRNESMVYQVEVLPVAYLMVSSVKSLTLRPDSELHLLPLRYTWSYAVSFHDSLGRKFDATSTHIGYRPHRFDTTDTFSRNRNRSLLLNLNQPGFAALKVWDLDNSKIRDFLPIPIGPAITPRDTASFTAGDIVCFSSPIAQGKWESEKSKVMEIVSDAGVGFAKSAGTSTVSHNVGSDATRHRVSVSAPSKLRFVADGKHVTNVPASSGGATENKPSVFVFPVLVGEGPTNIKGKDCLNRIKSLKSLSIQPPIACSMRWEAPGDFNPYHVFDVSPRYCAEHGKYYCEVKPLPLDTMEKYSRWNSHLLITATYQQDGAPDTNVRDAVISVPFYPAFYLYQNEIHLSNVQNTRVVFYISAADHIVSTIKVKASRNNLLRVSKIERDQSDPERWQIAVELLTRSQSLWHLYASNSGELADLHLMIGSELTGQERKVPVWIKLYGDTPKLGSFFSVDHFGFWEFMDALIEQHGSVLLVLVVILATLLAVYFGYRIVLSSGLYGGNPNQVVPNGTPYGYTQWRSYGGPQVQSFMSSDASSAASPGGFDPYQNSQKRQSLGGGSRTPYLWSLDRGQTPPNQSPNRSQPGL